MTTVDPAARSPLPDRGVIVPLVTPLTAGRQPDLDSLSSLIDFVIGAGVDGILVLGSSGEGAALSAAERLAVADHALGVAGGRIHVMVGVPPTGQRELIATARDLDALAPDSLLVTAPIGLSLSQDELARHFEAVAAAVGTPVVAYEVPSRVGVSLGAPLLSELGGRGLIAGVKDSSGNLVNGRLIATATKSTPGFVRYTGTEYCIDSELLAGYHASIPGIANVFPDFSVEIGRRATADDWRGAAAVQDAVVELLGLYSYPLPGASAGAAFFATVKEALVQLGVIDTAAVTAPLTGGDEGLRAHVKATLALGHELRDAVGVGR